MAPKDLALRRSDQRLALIRAYGRPVNLTHFKRSSTAFRIFPPSLMHSLNVFLQDVGSGKSVSCIVWENTLPSICILKRLLYSIYSIYTLSHGNLLKNRGSGNPTSRYSRDLKLCTHVHTRPEAQQKNFGRKQTFLSYLF